MIRRNVWREANFRLVPCAILFIAGATISYIYGHAKSGASNHSALALIGVLVFVFFAGTFLHILTSVIRILMSSHHLGAGRAAAIQFMLRTVGYIAITLVTLELLGFSIEKLLVGSAVLGIILGVAAQQALANFFASVVLLLARPFTVGEYITLKSGALGGQYDGLVIDIGLSHTKLQDEEGNVVFLPNATVLSGAAVMAQKPRTAPVETSASR